jgi:hypothetical protein
MTYQYRVVPFLKEASLMRAEMIGVLLVLLAISACSTSSYGSTASQAAPKVDPSTSKRQAKIVDPRRLVAEPDAHKGQNMIIQGKALNVTQNADYTWVNVQAQVPEKSTTESVVVEIRPKNPQVLKDECYRFYGMGGGSQKVTRLLTGAENSVAFINAYLVESAPSGKSGYGCADP